MASIKMEQFGGMLPAWDAHLLPNGQAAAAKNAYVFSGGLIGWRQPKLLYTLQNSTSKFAYRIPVVVTGTASDTLTVLINPLAGDNLTIGEMTYQFVAAIANPFDVLIGIDAPTSALNLFNAITLDGGLGTNQGITYGNGTSPNPSLAVPVSGATGVLTSLNGTSIICIAADTGAAYNTTPATESTSGARLSWATTPYFNGGIDATFDPTITGSSLWMEFADIDTNVLRSPVVNDQYNRYYMASPSLPPQYNTYDRIVGGQSNWLLGINPPGCAPEVSVVNGSDTAIIGNNTSSSTNMYAVGGNTIMLMQITPTENMSLIDCQIMPTTSNVGAGSTGGPPGSGGGIAPTGPSGPSWAAVMYSDNNGVPDLLLGVAAPVTGTTANTPILSEFANPIGVLANTPYWIGFATDTDQQYVALSDDLGSPGGVSMSNTYSNGPPGVFTPSGITPDLQMWADFQTASVIEGRAYVYTWVTAYDEESAPSPSTLVNGWSNGQWTVGMWSPTPDDMGVARNITTIRLYRTVPGTSGQTVFYWVCDLDIASNTISATTTTQSTIAPGGTVIVINPGTLLDTLGDDVVALNAQLPSTTWFPPPEGLQGIYNMPNGMMAGFKDNEIWFCEPYRPHAWPPSYVITTEFPIIGLGVSGMSVVAATAGTPYIATGVNPSSMSLMKMPLSAPALPGSRGAIITGGTAVFYPSQMGLIEVDTSAQAATNTTELWITREKWAQLTPQKNVRAVLQNSCYFAMGFVNGADDSVAQQGYTIELNTGDAQSFTIWPQPGGHRLGFGQLTAPNGNDTVNLLNDPWTGITMMIQNGGVYYYDFTDVAPTIIPYDWTTKVYQQKNKENFSAMRVFFTVPPNTPTQNVDRNEAPADDPSWNTLQEGQYGIVYVYADGNLITTREIVSNGELIRIASGGKYEEWQWRVQGRVLISNIQVATTVKELRNV